MTPERRNEILSKDVITTSELAELLDINRTYASNCMLNIKQKSDRLKLITGKTVKGKCHIQDYLDYFGLNKTERYGNYNEKPAEIRVVNPEDTQRYRKSVCLYSGD